MLERNHDHPPLMTGRRLVPLLFANDTCSQEEQEHANDSQETSQRSHDFTTRRTVAPLLLPWVERSKCRWSYPVEQRLSNTGRHVLSLNTKKKRYRFNFSFSSKRVTSKFVENWKRREKETRNAVTKAVEGLSPPNQVHYVEDDNRYRKHAKYYQPIHGNASKKGKTVLMQAERFELKSQEQETRENKKSKTGSRHRYMYR